MYSVWIWQLGPVHVFCFYRFVALQLNNLYLNLQFTYFTEKKFNTVFFSIFLAEQFYNIYNHGHPKVNDSLRTFRYFSLN
jgi:hypothetical protein